MSRSFIRTSVPRRTDSATPTRPTAGPGGSWPPRPAGTPWPARTDRRAQWVTGERRSAALILVSGRFRVELPGRSVLLAEQGDYVVFHGVNHSWHAQEASVVLAVRWPSVPGYAVPRSDNGTGTS